MTKQELSIITAEKSGLNHTESKELMNATFTVLAGYLSVQKSVSVPHFGTFDVHVRKGHKFFNLFLSKVMFAPKKYSIFFHPSKEYKEKIQQKLQS